MIKTNFKIKTKKYIFRKGRGRQTRGERVAEEKGCGEEEIPFKLFCLTVFPIQ